MMVEASVYIIRTKRVVCTINVLQHLCWDAWTKSQKCQYYTVKCNSFIDESFNLLHMTLLDVTRPFPYYLLYHVQPYSTLAGVLC